MAIQKIPMAGIIIYDIVTDGCTPEVAARKNGNRSKALDLLKSINAKELGDSAYGIDMNAITYDFYTQFPKLFASDDKLVMITYCQAKWRGSHPDKDVVEWLDKRFTRSE